MQPNLLIVGVPKAGTGSLFAYLAQHPDICAATQKEVGYFVPLSEPTGELAPMTEYESFFRHCGGQTYAMEATPAYCYGGRGLVAGIRRSLEQVRIVIVLRDPVDRLWSAYTFQRSLTNLPGIGSFDEYVAACAEQRRRSLGEHRNVPASGHLKGLAIGFYAEYLDHWFEAFPDHVRVVFFDDLASDPHRVVVDLCRWLGIDDSVASAFSFAAHNRTIAPRSLLAARAVFGAKRRLGGVLASVPRFRGAIRSVYLRVNEGELTEEMRPATRDMLLELYRDSNRAVAEELRSRGYALPGWLTAP